MKKIIILIIVMFFITGCYDFEELNNMNIVTGMGFDIEDGEYKISLEITKNKNSDKGSQKEKTVFTGKDKNLATAIAKARNNSDKKVYFKHVDAVLISEDIAEEGIISIMDYLLRDSNMSTTYFTIICEDANELLNMELDNDTMSNLIVSMITSHIDSEILNNIDVIVSDIINKKVDIALPYIEKKEDKEINAENIAYFNNDKMVGKINNKMYNFLHLNNKNIVIENDDNVLNIYDKKIKYDVRKDKIIINVMGDGKIVSLNKEIDFDDTNNYKKVEKSINEKIEKEVNDFLEETLKKDADLIGFEDLYFKKYHKEIDDIDYDVVAKVKLVRSGSITEAIND